MNKKSMLIMLLILLGVNVNAYEYNQILTAYQGGVIGSLNNCGVNFSTNPKYLRGAGSISIQAPGSEFFSITKLGDTGIVSVTKKGAIYYSPDGLNLNGGGASISLGVVPVSTGWSSSPPTNPSSFIAVEVEDENKVLIFSSYEDGEVSVLVDSSQAKYVSIDVDTKFIGYANGLLYQQKKSGEIYTYQSIDDFLLGKKHTYIETSQATVKGIKHYNNGLLTLANGKLYYSASSQNLFSGAENMYPDYSDISNMEIVLGEKKYIPITSSDITFFVPNQKQDIILAHHDGTISWNGQAAINPINTTTLKRYLAYALDFPEYKIESLHATILNYDEDKVYGNGFFVALKAEAETMALAVGLNGQPATVSIKDRGWSGFEYRWRNKGQRTGIFNHEYSGDLIGSNKMKIIASHSCTAVVSFTATNIDPIQFNKNLDPFFQVISDNYVPQVIKGIETLSSKTGFPVLDWYLDACEVINNVVQKIPFSPDPPGYGCPTKPDEFYSQDFNPMGGTHFSIENDDVAWKR